jgi:hypothetical protein
MDAAGAPIVRKEAAMRRFSISSIMGLILIIAVGVAALRNADEIWAGIILMVALGMGGVAILGVLHSRGRDRAWWAGFTIFAWGYLVLAFGPWFAVQIRPRLATTLLLDYLHSTPGYYDQFLMVGHSLFAPIAGWIGAMISTHLHAKCEKANAPATEPAPRGALDPDPAHTA